MDKIIACFSDLAINESQRDPTLPMYGIFFASIEFKRNLLRYGGFDSYHFLVGSDDTAHEAANTYLQSNAVDPKKVVSYNLIHTPERFRATNYHVLQCLDPDIAPMLELRYNLEGPIAPVIGMTHTISYQSLTQQWMNLCLTRMLPCDALVCTSQAVRGILDKTFEIMSDRLDAKLGGQALTYGGSLEVIPLGVDTDYWHPNDDKQQARKQLGLPSRQCLILCPGRLSVYDKMDLRPLLLATRSLLDSLGPESFQLLLVGDDKRCGESKLLKKLIKKIGVEQVVRIDTNGDPNVVRQYYGASDVFLSLVDNIQETFGLTVTQAMACGLPTVVSDWNGYKDTVVHGETGFRVPTYWADCDEDISHFAPLRLWLFNHLFLAQSVAIDMAKAMDYLYTLITNPELRHRQGQAARQRAEQLYSWPTVIGHYRELWDECRRKLDAFDFQQWVRQERRSVLSPAWFRRFSHYPSGIISPETVIMLSVEQDSVSIPNFVNDVCLPDAMENMFRTPILRWLIEYLSKNRATFRSLQEDGSRETGYSHDLVARHIMWLMKYGVVKPMVAQSVLSDMDMKCEEHLIR